jgi:transcriptional regulator with XRE-family HTH domain
VANEGPLLHRRRLGAELRRLRGERTLEEVAEATLISTSKLSRLENGQGVPQPRDIRDLVQFFGLDTGAADRLRRWASAGRRQAWWRVYAGALPANLDIYLDYESGASTIRQYASSMVPPLLQTSAYAAHLYRALPPVRNEETVKRLVEIQLRRQELLVDSDTAPQFIVVLDEAVLHRPFGRPADVQEQLDHLQSVSRQRNVSLRVLPFESGLHAGLQGHFTTLHYADDIDRDIVVVESHTVERFLEQQSDVLEYLQIFDSLTRKTLDHDESRAFLAALRDGAPAKGSP